MYLDHPALQVLYLLVLCCHLIKERIIIIFVIMIIINTITLALCMAVAS